LERSWRVRSEGMVRELVTGKVAQEHVSTVRGRPDRWNSELWSKVYGFEQGGEGMATKRDDCTRDKFTRKLDAKYGYFVRDCKDIREKRVLAFLVPILNPEKPYNITLTLASTIFLSFAGERMVDWGHLVGDQVHKLASITKRGLPTYIGPFLFHLYDQQNLLTVEEETQWTSHQILRELQTADSESEDGQEDSKEEEAVEISDEELPISRKRKLMEETPPVRTRAAARAAAGEASTARAHPLDSIIQGLIEVRNLNPNQELQLQQVGELVGNPPREELVAAVKKAIQEPHQLQKMERKMEHLTMENKKMVEKVQKLKSEREGALNQVKESALTIQRI
jgi:hypothetical protein